MNAGQKLASAPKGGLFSIFYFLFLLANSKSNFES
jgi:hypothetical protein